MSESPEVAGDPPAVKALRDRRQKASNSLRDYQRQTRILGAELGRYQGYVDDLEAEIADIDRAIQALNYPD